MLGVALLSCAELCSGQGGGAIRGAIRDRDFDQPVPGVQITVTPGGVSIKSGPEGTFLLPGLAPGTYELLLTKDDFVSERATGLIVTPDRITEVRLEMTADVQELDEFIVAPEELTSPEAITAIDIRDSLVGIGDVLTADFIAKSGADDAGEALTRVVGTSVVDSRYVVVRGLSDRYNTVLLNGARVPSSDPDKRAVNVDIFPGGLIEALTNTKTFSPELPGESTGGSINIITRAIPREPFVDFSVSWGYNDQASYNPVFLTYKGGGVGMFGNAEDRQIPARLKATDLNALRVSRRPDPELTALRDEFARTLNPVTGTTIKEAPPNFSVSAGAGTTFEFMGRPAGLIAAFTYKKDYSLDPEYTVGRATVAMGAETQESLYVGSEGSENLLAGLLVSGGIELENDGRIAVTYFANVAAEDSALFLVGEDAALSASPNDSVPLELEENVTVAEALRYTERTLRTLQFSGIKALTEEGNAKAKWVAAYSQSAQKEPDLRFSRYNYNRLTGRFADVGADFSGRPFERIWRELNDQSYNLGLDVTAPLFGDLSVENGTGAEAFFGLNLDRGTREYRADNFAYEFNPLSAAASPELLPSDAAANTAADQITEIDRATTARGRRGDPIYLFRNGPEETYEATQTIAAAYGGMKVGITENFEVIVGARVEDTQIELRRDGEIENPNDLGSNNLLTTDLRTGEALPAEEIGKASIDEVNGLPMLSATWGIAENMNLRLATSRTVARPSFKELAPVFTRDPGTSTRFVGNTLLETSQISNYDVRWEWFPEPGDVIAVSGFAKSIESPIELNTRGAFDFFLNENSGTIYGLEIEVQKNLDDFSPWLDDVDVGFNFAKIFSSVELSEGSRLNRTRAGLSTSRRIQGQPDYILNFNVNYDDEDRGISAGMFLNVTGELLYASGGVLGDAFAPDVYQQPFTSLDLVFAKRVLNDWKLTFRVSNITGSRVERRYEGGSIYSGRGGGTGYSVGLSGKW